METKKRYYWLKLREDFFSQVSIRLLRKMPEGATMVIIYLELLLLSIQNDGYIYAEGICDSLEEELALALDEDVVKIKLALGVLEKAKLLERGEDYDARMTHYPEMVGSEAASTRRVREFRRRKALPDEVKALHCNTDETPVKRNVNAEREKEIEIDIEKRKEGEGEELTPALLGDYHNVYLTEEDAEALTARYQDAWRPYIDRLSSYIASTGKTYENHAATIRRWIERDREKMPANREYSENEEGSL